MDEFELLLITIIALMAVLRIAILAHYFRTVLARTRGRRVDVLMHAARLPTGDLMGGGLEAHRSVVTEDDRQVELSLVGGAIALAAWTQLYVSSESSPGNKLGGVTLGLLFAGAVVLLVTPVLFRSPPRHTTYLGRVSGVYLGYNSIVLSLCGAIRETLGGNWWVLGAGVAVVVFVRDIAAVKGVMDRTRISTVPSLPSRRSEMRGQATAIQSAGTG